MCIIVIKKSGVELPSKEILETCWRNNPDGGGYMFARNGKVEIRKGFMSFNNLWVSLNSLGADNLKKIPIILHFRIGTSGGNIPQNTHPFPITKDVSQLQSLRKKCDVAVAHNGIISINQKRKDISDTMEYISTRLYKFFELPFDILANKFILDIIEDEIDSKFAFLEGNGRITTIGTFNEKDGIWYSNYTYEKKKYSYNSHAYNYLYDDDDDYAFGYYTTPKKTEPTIIFKDIPRDYYIMLADGTEYEQNVDGKFTISQQTGSLWKDEHFECWHSQYVIFDTVGNIVEWYAI